MKGVRERRWGRSLYLCQGAQARHAPLKNYHSKLVGFSRLMGMLIEGFMEILTIVRKLKARKDRKAKGMMKKRGKGFKKPRGSFKS